MARRIAVRQVEAKAEVSNHLVAFQNLKSRKIKSFLSRSVKLCREQIHNRTETLKPSGDEDLTVAKERDGVKVARRRH